MSAIHAPYSKLFKLRSRGSLIVATVILQAVVVGLGWFGTVELAKLGLGGRIQEQAIEQNTQAVNQMVSALRVMVGGPLSPEAEGWEVNEQLIEKLASFQGVSLDVLDENGRHIFRSAGVTETGKYGREVQAITPGPLKAEGTLLGNTVVTLLPGRETMLLKELRPGTVVTCEAQWFGEPATLCVRWDDVANVKLIAFQTRASLKKAEAKFTEGVLWWSGAAGTVVLGITVLGSAFLVRRYDTVLLRLNRTLEDEVERRLRRALSIRNGLVFGLAKLADYRDTDTGKHLERICKYCEILGQQLIGKHPEVNRAWVDLLKLASSMHDIGKVGIPDSILLKPGPLTPEERTQMQTHSNIGAETLLAIRQHVGDDELINMSIHVAMCHHEKYDGTGYPNKMAREQIPLSARIVALADIYDAMTSKRVYKDAMSHEQAKEMILNSKGTHLDPMVVQAFEEVQEQFDMVRAQLQPAGGAVEQRDPSLFVDQNVVASTMLIAKTRKAA